MKIRPHIPTYQIRATSVGFQTQLQSASEHGLTPELDMLVTRQITTEEASAASAVVVSPSSPAVESQVLHEIASLPDTWEQMLVADGVQVVVLASNESLLDSAWVNERSIKDFDTQLRDTRGSWEHLKHSFNLTQDSVTERPLSDLDKYLTGKELQKNWSSDSAFRLAELKPGSFSELLSKHAQSEADRAKWTQAFRELNGDFLSGSKENLSSAIGTVVCPPPCHNGKFLEPELYDYAQQKTGVALEESLGLHNNDHRLVMVAESYAKTDSQDFGWYRTTLHEVGHALDYAFERRDPTHHDKIQELFTLAQAREGKGLWLSDRADDNVREYFAEGIEAYLTCDSKKEPHSERESVSQEELKKRDPGLFHYIETLASGA